MTKNDHFDVCLVGAGVVGLATACTLSRHSAFKQSSLLLLEQHKQFGQETSSRNSEVIHAGLYYPGDSLKARMCVEGKQRLYRYCESHNIACRRTGKLVVASAGQEDDLAALGARAENNGVLDLIPLDQKQLKTLEPEVSAACGLLSPSSGIIDSHAYMQSLLHQAESAGLIFSPLTRCLSIGKIPEGYRVECDCQGTPYSFSCTRIVICAGLHAQVVAKSIEGFPASCIPEQQLVKGSYFSLQGKSPFRHLVYPLPEPGLLGLGIHATLDMAGQVKFGPDTEPVNSFDYEVAPEKEVQFRESISRYFPGVRDFGLQPAYSGIRPKLKSASGVADFMIHNGDKVGFPGLIQLFGIESPGLTASLAIAERIAGQLI